MKPSSAGSTGESESRNRVAFEPSNSVADYDALLTRIPTIDDVLDGHASALGNDSVAYRNHVYRVLNMCVAIVGSRGEVEKVAAAAVFHDLGIWTDRTFDYIAPSIALAREYLVARAREDWITEISTMISDHHKITPSMANPNSLVEPFRQADWIDVTGGLRRFGIPRPVCCASVRNVAGRGISLAPSAASPSSIPNESADTAANGQTVMATRSGADTLLIGKRSLVPLGEARLGCIGFDK